jgi:phospholipid/cholesterol/gamma-HCH transport system substrate-binding protein
MSKEIRWRDLVPGLAALSSLCLAALAVLVFARVGAMHGDTARLFALVGDATGVMSGTQVWLDGEKIGLVHGVSFRPPSADSSRRLAIELEITRDALGVLRQDSYAQIKPGGKLIGAPVVHLNSGSNRARALHEGDSVIIRPSTQLDAIREQLVGTQRDLPDLIANVRVLRTGLRAATGTVGAFMSPESSAHIHGTSVAVQRLTAAALHGSGSLGAAYSRGMGPEAALLRKRVDSLRTLVTEASSGVSRVRSGVELQRSIASLRSEITAVRARAADSSAGTIGRARADLALSRELASMQSELDALMTDVKKRPLRYLNF